MVDSEQLEIGIKHQIEGTGLQFNVAVFDITMKDLLIDNPNSPDPNLFTLIPEQTSQGVEIGFTWMASDAFQLYGNAATLNAETDTGETPTFTPEQTFNLGFAWTLGEAFRIIADARYVGERETGYPATPMPSYTVVDASARWDINDKLRHPGEGRQYFRRAVRDFGLSRRPVARREAAHGERRIRLPFLAVHRERRSACIHRSVAFCAAVGLRA